jgi:hypothetical protein
MKCFDEMLQGDASMNPYSNRCLGKSRRILEFKNYPVVRSSLFLIDGLRRRLAAIERTSD